MSKKNIKYYSLIGTIIGLTIGLFLALNLYHKYTITSYIHRSPWPYVVELLIVTTIGGTTLGYMAGVLAKKKINKPKKLQKKGIIVQPPSEQKEDILYLIKLQKKYAVILIYASISTILGWFFIEKNLDIFLVLLLIFLLGGGIYVRFYILLPIFKIKSEIGSKGLNAFPECLPASSKKNFLIMILGLLFFLAIMILIFIFQKFMLILPLLGIFLFLIGIIGFLINRSNEKRLINY
jgi:MFS family permease